MVDVNGFCFNLQQQPKGRLCWMSSRPTFAGVKKKGRAQRSIASRPGESMSSGSSDRSQDRTRATSQQDRPARRSSGPRQLITFVDSQDPNSRSTIQRHTAHHSNAQRRDARLQSLRNTSRPRILQWTRRRSAEILPVTSPGSSNSSSSVSPLPPLQRPQPPGSEPETSVSAPLHATELEQQIQLQTQSQSLQQLQPQLSQLPLPPPPPSLPPPASSEVRDQTSPERESTIQYLTEVLCRHAPDRDSCREIIEFAKTDEACVNLLLAYAISLRHHNGDSLNPQSDSDIARMLLNRGTSILRARLSDSATALADANIQAVLLLIAYTADFGEFEDVRFHATALRTMTDQRGGTGEGTYPPILALQLRNIGESRYLHLTLDCAEPCDTPIRFPRGLYGV